MTLFWELEQERVIAPLEQIIRFTESLNAKTTGKRRGLLAGTLRTSHVYCVCFD